MITDNQTNKVYFSEWLQKDFPIQYNEIHTILDRYNIPHELLCHTKDYWCHDYMPIQIEENRFIQYRYYPDYLSSNKDAYYISEPSRICESLGIKTDKTDLIIDGGNIVKCKDTIVMTEKVFKENPQYTQKQLTSKLEGIFQANFIFLPWDKKEKYGHSDGIVRYISGDRVLLTNYRDFDSKIADEIIRRLSQCFDVVELNYTSTLFHNNTWAYINFLQTDNIIIIPKLGIEEDEQAMIQFKTLFPEYKEKIIQINITPILKLGGAFNCISWNIKTNIS